MEQVLTQPGEGPTKPIAPRYLVYPVDWDSIDSQFVSDQPYVIDFGESFEASDPPNDLGIPGPYCSPEFLLDKVIGIGCDLWALGCTLFEIRTGRKLFNPFDDDQDQYLDSMVQILGRLPEPWWSTTWEIRKKWYEDEADSQGRAVSTPMPIQETRVNREEQYTVDVHPAFIEGARSLQERLAPGLWYIRDKASDIHWEISKEEISIFADLLSKLLQFDPKCRLTAKAVQDHEWFRM